jgi:hypothetical protein
MTPTWRMSLAATVLFLCSSAHGFALTEGQCLFFVVDGRTAICHATGSPHAPFAPLDAPLEACINGHVSHAGDYVAVGDPECQGGACLPAGAPCDASLPCCEGLACNAGTCEPAADSQTTASRTDDVTRRPPHAPAGDETPDRHSAGPQERSRLP